MNPESNYSKEITQKSFQELEKIAKWLNIHASHPIVIGGWATYYYVKGLGSRDIDLVLHEKAFPILKKYCLEHGYTHDPSTKTRFHFSKESGKEKIDLDIFTFEHKNKLAKNPKIEISWSLVKENSQDWQIGNAMAKVPNIEVLLLYKTAALIDRKYKLEKWALQPFSKQQLNSKIWKDIQDIKEILKQKINQEKLDALLKQTKFKKEYKEAIKQL
ncbi:hypothetical protein HZB88_02385 [archaeon]|nr:hypothetical protein [archaeon]